MRFKQYALAFFIITILPFISCNNNNSISSADTTSAIKKDTAKEESIDTTSNIVGDTIVNLIKRSLLSTLVKNDLSTLTDNDRRFVYSTIDLNDDGKQEIFVGMKGSYFCGNAGCTVFLLNSEAKQITMFSIVDGPITVINEKSNGWKQLIIPSRGINYLVKFDGKKYPSNPSVQSKFNGSLPTNAVTVLDDNLKEQTF